MIATHHMCETGGDVRHFGWALCVVIWPTLSSFGQSHCPGAFLWSFGLLSGYFLFCEDMEYCRRVVRAGWKLLYTRDARISHHEGKSAEHWFETLFPPSGRSGLHPVDAVMAADVVSYLPYDLLVKVDITSMAHGLEARSPFLDHEVMEFAARLPTPLKLRVRRRSR